MNNQKGAAAVGIVALVALAAAAAAGYYAWQQKQESGRIAAELERTSTQLAAARAEERKARGEAEAARKELDEQKGLVDQLRTERDSARAFLEAEKTHGERLQAELTLMQQQIAYLRTRGSSYGGVTPNLAPQARPLEVRIAPHSGSRQAVKAAPAPTPAAQ